MRKSTIRLAESAKCGFEVGKFTITLQLPIPQRMSYNWVLGGGYSSTIKGAGVERVFSSS
jgi:hypothetical protein